MVASAANGRFGQERAITNGKRVPRLYLTRFLSDVKMESFRIYPETQRDMRVLVLENTFSSNG